MVDKTQLLERLMATFLDELDEHVRVINDEVMALEKRPEDDEVAERLTRLFRAAHSLKGAARAVDQPGIEQACHRMENVFTGLRDGRVQPTDGVCSLMLDVADAIETAGMQLREKSHLDSTPLDSLIQRLDAAANGEPAAEPEAVSSGEPQTQSPSISPGEQQNLPPDSTAQKPPAAPSSPASPTAASRGAQALPTTIRVAEEKLDSLLAQSGELLVARQRIEARPRDLDPLLEDLHTWRTEWRSIVGTLRQLVRHNGDDPLVRRSSRLKEQAARAIEVNEERIAQLEEQLERLSGNLTADSRQLKLASTALQDDVHRIRMLPFAQACAGLERAVRDVCRTSGKIVDLVVQGGDIEVDRSVLEGLSDPLLHLVRNAADHGIEPPDERVSAGKAETATVTVRAAIHGAEVDVTVADDGRGLNLSRIRQRLRDRGLPEPADDRELARSIFLPGFSTAEVVTDVSGRGVGMDVVKSRIEALHGRIDIASEPGLGTRFTLSVPLTLTTVSALFVRCGSQTLAFPTSTVARLVRFEEHSLKRQHGRTVLSLGEVPIRVVSLADLLEFPDPEATAPMQTAVLASVGNRQLLIVVDEVLAEREAVIKTLGPRILHVPHVSGAIALGTGELALLLNTHNLLQSVESGGSSGLRFSTTSTGPPATSSAEPARRVLVADDSLTTRTLIKSILETAGYDVVAASNGQEAWERLQGESVDVVVTDIDDLRGRINESADLSFDTATGPVPGRECFSCSGAVPWRRCPWLPA